VAIINHPEANKIPMSPIRLYIIAWRAAVLASARVNHHPISRKDRNPTPSQPISSWNMLLAEIRRIIAIRKMVRNRKNSVMLGSEDI